MGQKGATMHDYYEITFKVRFSPKHASDEERTTFNEALKVLCAFGCNIGFRIGEENCIVVTSGGWQSVESEPTSVPLKEFNLFDNITSDCITYCVIVNDGWKRTTFERSSKSVRNIQKVN